MRLCFPELRCPSPSPAGAAAFTHLERRAFRFSSSASACGETVRMRDGAIPLAPLAPLAGRGPGRGARRLAAQLSSPRPSPNRLSPLAGREGTINLARLGICLLLALRPTRTRPKRRPDDQAGLTIRHKIFRLPRCENRNTS